MDPRFFRFTYRGKSQLIVIADILGWYFVTELK